MDIDLNIESNMKHNGHVTNQQIQTSPNKVTVMIPDDQLQMESIDSSFQVIGGKEKGKKKGKKEQSKDTIHPKGGNSF